MLNNKKPMGKFVKKPVVIQNNTKYRPGDVVTLKVVRLGEMGAFLDGGTGNTDDDILLHKLQQTAEVKEGDAVKVYLYLDPSKLHAGSQALAGVQIEINLYGIPFLNLRRLLQLMQQNIVVRITGATI